MVELERVLLSSSDSDGFDFEREHRLADHSGGGWQSSSRSSGILRFGVQQRMERTGRQDQFQCSLAARCGRGGGKAVSMMFVGHGGLKEKGCLLNEGQ